VTYCTYSYHTLECARLFKNCFFIYFLSAPWVDWINQVKCLLPTWTDWSPATWAATSNVEVGQMKSESLYLPLIPRDIGGGSYWAGRATARQLFCPCGPPMCLARPLLGT